MVHHFRILAVPFFLYSRICFNFFVHTCLQLVSKCANLAGRETKTRMFHERFFSFTIEFEDAVLNPGTARYFAFVFFQLFFSATLFAAVVKVCQSRAAAVESGGTVDKHFLLHSKSPVPRASLSCYFLADQAYPQWHRGGSHPRPLSHRTTSSQVEVPVLPEDLRLRTRSIASL